MVEMVRASIPVDASLTLSCSGALATLKAREDIGFFKVASRENLWDSCEQLREKYQGKFDHYVVVGIGGSALGARAIAEIFHSNSLFFIDNVDVDEYQHLLKTVPDISKTLFLFISKSGSTIETLCALEFLNQHLLTLNLFLPRQAVVVTEQKSNPLYDWAVAQKVPCLEIPVDVGGRYSVLTPVGMLPAALAGLNIRGFQKGALEALQSETLVVQIMAQTLQSFQRENWITLFWFYNSSMRFFGAWLQQLWAESLAKVSTRSQKTAPRVSTPMSAIGAIDQHSILQQVMEGARDKFVIFQRVESSEAGFKKLESCLFPQTELLLGRTMGELLKAEALATEEALRAQGVHSLSLKTKVLNEESVGFQFMLWMLVVGALGEYLNINAFDQPGVEAGKVLARKMLESKT